MVEPVIKYASVEEWQRAATSLFGSNIKNWRFECPVCRHAASPADFEKYKAQGATPESASQECLGRYQPNSRKAFGNNSRKTPKQPCDYAAYGLFRLGTAEVTIEGGKTLKIFGFAQPVVEEKKG